MPYEYKGSIAHRGRYLYFRLQNTIIKDREEIEKFIEKLDAEKKRALQTAFKKVL